MIESSTSFHEVQITNQTQVVLTLTPEVARRDEALRLAVHVGPVADVSEQPPVRQEQQAARDVRASALLYRAVGT